MSAATGGRGRRFLGRRAGETTPAGDSGAAVREVVRWVGRLLALAVVGCFVLAALGRPLNPLLDAVDRLRPWVRDMGGLAGLAAAYVALRGKPGQANTEVASVDALAETRRVARQQQRVLAGLQAAGVDVGPDPDEEWADVVRAGEPAASPAPTSTRSSRSTSPRPPAPPPT